MAVSERSVVIALRGLWPHQRESQPKVQEAQRRDSEGRHDQMTIASTGNGCQGRDYMTPSFLPSNLFGGREQKERENPEQTPH